MRVTPDSTLADPQQIIADLQRQLAECRAERDEALAERDKAQRRLAERTGERDEVFEQQTATAEVLQVINSSPGDLTPVFDRAICLCEAAYGVFWTYNGEGFRAATLHGVPQPYAASLSQEPTQFATGTNTALGQIAEGSDFAHFDDVATEEGYMVSGARRLIELGGARTVMVVALRKDGKLLGAISAFRQQVRPFADRQIALLQNFAAQVVIAIENARLLTETREALEQQTATSEVLQVINSSPGDLVPVFDAMLERAIRLCTPAFGVLFTWDGERFHRVAWRGGSEEAIEASRGAVIPPPGSPGYRLVHGENSVSIADLAADEIVRTTPVQYLLRFGAHSYVTVALRKEGRLLGMLTVYRQEVRPFTDKEIALLQNFAAQAVIAMENARLINETREALEQQTATSEVLQVINSSPGDLGPIFEAMLEKATRLCEAPFGILRTWDGECFHFGAVHGEPTFREWVRQRGPTRPDASPLGRIQAGEHVVRFADEPGDEGYWNSAGFREMVEASAIRRGIWVALRKDDELLGTITVFRREPRPFSEKQVALLENFAAQAVIAMENARLLTETREALEQQTATAEVLQVINSSPGDLEPVFEAILQKAHDLCGAGNGALFMRDGERFKPVAFRGAPDPMANYLRQYGLGPDAPAVSPLLDGARFVHIPDMRDIDHPAARAAAANGVLTLLSVPLRKDLLLGTINAVRFEVRPFVDKEISLLENFAAQAVIAMENARLLGELRQRTEEVAELNRGLEARVAEQVDELGRVGRLKRFLAPQLAELIVSQGDEKILESHRREIVVVFCDLRGYTAFTETAEPEEVLEFLRQYHGALGPLVSQYEGTLDQFSGDGIMVFFNDPVPCPDPAERAVKMAMAMREAAGKLIAAWRRHGCELGFGAGIAQGYATLGQIGFSERSGYTAIGTVCNLAARLCAEAKDGQILVSSRIAGEVEAVVKLEDLGNLELKGLRRPVAAFNVVQSTSAADARPNLTVVAKGPGA